MKRIIAACLLVCLTILGMNCQKELNYNLPGENTGTASPLTATLQMKRVCPLQV